MPNSFDSTGKVSKRPLPTAAMLQWRAGFLAAFRRMAPGRPLGAVPPEMSPGNKKTGVTGTLFEKVLVWNLPPVATCPGASSWCLKNCYNADDRNDIFPIREWQENWSWAIHNLKKVKEKIISQLKECKKPTAVRIHSSGDFFSQEYVQFWEDIADSAPEVSFWAYTRSWMIADMLPELEKLRERKNVQLFASWDETMPQPPSGWRLAFVLDRPDSKISDRSPAEKSITCPEQTGELPNCASCGFCISKRVGDVIFYLH